MPSFRRARPEDYDAIARQVADVQAMHAAALPALFKPPSAETFPRERFLALLASPVHDVVAAVEGEDVLGHAVSEEQAFAESAFKYAYAEVHLHQLAVRPDARGRGIGTLLLGAVRAAARARGIATISLNVWDFNDGARRFYAHAGFAPTRGWLALRDGVDKWESTSTAPSPASEA